MILQGLSAILRDLCYTFHIEARVEEGSVSLFFSP